ncbi:S8 family serine peptidase [Lihuaxuella thermophila]|uniref:Serine protease, subtilisin family n=1 Tax=Lihuaxuella thermophila TaxID=1173111 RepID=A0A1H8GXL0_9BACL|nr:S8 family serine peptidase [Lihuaxuella thermophila]SEN48871.1 Serine protease, subtilisin family [Lihuaxuella thermophila]
MRKLISASLSIFLAAAMIAPGTAGSASAESAGQQKYTINFKGAGVPENAGKMIQDAGGTLVRSDAELAFAQAVSNDPHFLDKIRANPSVEDAGRTLKIVQDQPVKEEASLNTTNPSLYDQQWDIQQVTQNGASYQLPGGKGNKNIVVGIIDTGVDLEHPDLKNNIVDAKSFVPGEATAQDVQGHGTHVAGAVAANGKVLGVGPELGIGALKVFAADGYAETVNIAAALKYAADKDYDVVNMSLGDYLYLQDPEHNTNDIRADLNLFKKAIAYATKKGVTVVGSAGNAAANITNPGQLTRFFDEENNGATHRDPSTNLLIRVSSGNKNKQLAYYSNYGVGKIDVMSPGGDRGPHYDPATRKGADPSYMCLSTVPIVDSNQNVIGHGYARYIGTSMAAPKVAGLAGVIIAKHGKNNLTPAQVKAIIEQSAEDIYKSGYDAESGFGLVNAVNALHHP